MPISSSLGLLPSRSRKKFGRWLLNHARIGTPNPRLGRDSTLVGHPALEDAPEQVFGLATAQAKIRGQPASELHQGMIQQRHPRLQGMRHAHPVYLGQDVPRQVGPKIQVLKARERIEAPAIVQSAPRRAASLADATPASSRSRRARSGNKEIASR